MRAFLIVIDSFGVGELPDAYKYGDEGSNTFLNILNTLSQSTFPNNRKTFAISIDFRTFFRAFGRKIGLPSCP